MLAEVHPQCSLHSRHLQLTALLVPCSYLLYRMNRCRPAEVHAGVLIRLESHVTPAVTHHDETEAQSRQLHQLHLRLRRQPKIDANDSGGSRKKTSATQRVGSACEPATRYM